ncbi:MAG TPA: hypothetical protein VMI56_07220 [Reyranella sp.]|nr:hypothetical protein [Reyranella sp.]
MGQMGTLAMALASAHDLNKMFVDNNNATWKRLSNLRSNVFPSLLTPSSAANPPGRVQSLRFAASELTRQVSWNASDPSRGDRRLLLRWLTWVEMDPTRRVEAQKLVAALDYFVKAPNAASAPTITFSWNEDYSQQAVSGNGTFSIVVNPAITSTTVPGSVTAITVAVTSTDIYHTAGIGSAPEDD